MNIKLHLDISESLNIKDSMKHIGPGKFQFYVMY